MSPSARRQWPALVVVGCCLAAVLTAGVTVGAIGPDGAPTPAIESDSNTSNYLQPPTGDSVREGSTVQGVGVGVAIAADADTLAGRFERSAAEQRIQATTEPEQRLDTIRNAFSNLSARTARLRAEGRQLRAAYRSGAISEQTFFYRTARLQSAADRAGQYRELLRERLEAMGAKSEPIYSEVQGLHPDIETLQGPVSDVLLSRYAGTAGSGSTFVRVTGNGGYVLSTLAEGNLRREAQQRADWNHTGVDEFSEQEGIGAQNQARERAMELYPWAFSHQFGLTNPPGPFTSTTLYKVLVSHEHGELTIYLDGTTREVFRELQEKNLQSLPMNWHRSTTASGIRLNVSGTHPTGALYVSVSRPQADVSIDSDIRIDGTPVGSTSADGALWTVQPSGGFTVNATTDGDSVTLTVPAELT